MLTVVPKDDVAVLAGENGTSTDEPPTPDLDTSIGGSLGVEDDEVVHDDIVTDADLGWVSEDSPATKRDIAPDSPEQKRIECPSQNEAKGPWDPGNPGDDELEKNEIADPPRSDHQILVLPKRTLPATRELLLDCHWASGTVLAHLISSDPSLTLS